MIPVSTQYRQELIKGNRNYKIKAEVFLSTNQTSTPDFTLTNEEIWDNGITIDEAISSSDSFDIGTAIVGSLQVVINNINGNYSEYDFYGAKITLWLGVEGDLNAGEQRYYRKGFYVVDEPSYNGSLITLNCLDNMTWFDVPYSGVNFPTSSNTTAGQLVSSICSYVGVTLGTVSFPNYTMTIYKKSLVDLTKSDINCREVLQYVAQKCCCYCKITTAGQLALKWHDKTAITGLIDWDGGTYNTNTTPYSDGDDVEGGFWDSNGNPYGDYPNDVEGGFFSDLENEAWLSQNFEMNVSTDNIIVTGVHIRSTNGEDDDHYDELWVNSTIEQTNPRYVLVIENNPLIIKTEAASVAQTVGTILAGLPIRAFDSRSLSDFSYETGDMVTIVDFRGNVYYSWITGFTFTTNNSESFSCGAQSVRKRSETRYSSIAKTLAEAQQFSEDHLSAYDAAVKAMNDLGTNAVGYTEYVYPTNAIIGETRTVWRYDGSSRTGTASAPKFPNSNAVFKITGDGVFVALRANGDIASDGTCTFSNGYDANSGTAILNTLYAKGISCDSIKSGRLSLGGSDNGKYKNGELYMYNSSDSETGHWNRDGISILTGTLTLGEKTSIDHNHAGVYIGSDGIGLGARPTGSTESAFKVTNAGALTAQNATITGTVTATGGSIGGCNITGGVLSVPMANVSGNLSAERIAVGTISSCTLSAGTISGSTKFEMTANGSSYDTTLNWGSTWGDSLTVVANQNNDGGLGVCQKNHKNDRAVYVHWDDIEFYDDNYNPLYAKWTANKGDSDKRLKKNVKKLTSDILQKFYSNLEPIIFNYKKKVGVKGTFFGVFAQDMEKALDSIGINDAPLVYESKGYKKIVYADTIGLQIGAIKDLYEIVNKQQEEIDLLKQEVAELKARKN